MNKPRSNRSLLKSFISSDASTGIVLILAAVAAMILANNPSTAQGYQSLLSQPVQIRFGALDIGKNLLLWINDAMMALFFLVIGLEVKRELESLAKTIFGRIQFAIPKRHQSRQPAIDKLCILGSKRI